MNTTIKADMQTTDTITLAVLPFEDLSTDKQFGIFCRSFSDELSTELSRFRQLRIVNLPDVIDTEASIKDTWSKDTAYRVEGSFRSEKEQVKINVQLYNSLTRELVWGNRFEGKLTSLDEIQNNLLKGLVAVLQQQIDLDLLSKIKRRPKVEFTAYEHWLYGMEEIKKASVEADLKARMHFEKALEIQPDYALACSGMSLSYFNEWTCQLWDRWDISKSGAYEWAQKAIALDDQNHVIAMVLGRIFLYEGAYETAEYYFKRSMMLNPNDPDTILPISLYIIFLGLNEEALELYERGLHLNPFYAGSQIRLGGVIYFELGDYEKAATFIKHNQMGKSKIADTDAYISAIYFYLKDYVQMDIYWKSFLDTYRVLIAKGQDFEEQQAIDWILKLNPHRYKTNLEGFLQHISKGSFEKYPVQQKPVIKFNNQENSILKEDQIWKFSFDGNVVLIPEVKGFYDLQKMLLQPGQVFHCAELMGSVLEGSGQKLIDEKARRQYQKKVLDLQSELEEAELHSDYKRIEQLQQSYDGMIEHLSQTLGLKGKIREKGSSIEKARSAVTWRIRNAIAKVEQAHPSLGAHLSNAIKTGTLCSYKPDKEFSWTDS